METVYGVLFLIVFCVVLVGMGLGIVFMLWVLTHPEVWPK
ncbi:hypothetical protein ES703_107896 [subsurface metagenome]